MALCAAAAGAAPGADPADWYLRGLAEMRFSWRADGGQHDSDLRERFWISFGEGGKGRVSGYAAGFLTHDLDGTAYGDRFGGLADARGRTYGQLSAAYIDLRPESGPLDAARVGRQWFEEVPELVRVDGVRLESAALTAGLDTRMILFAGIPDHLYESSRRGDRVYGGGLTARPWRDARLAAVFARIHDTYQSRYVGAGERVSRRDDCLRFSYRQLLLDRRFLWWSEYALLENEPRELRLRASYDLPSGKTSVSGHFTWVFSRLDALSTECDPYYSVLRSLYPYREAGVLVRHDCADWLDVGGGVSVRRLVNGGRVGPYNHEFERYYVTAALRELPLPTSEFVATANCYDTGSDRTWAVEGSYAQRLGASLRCEIGSGYSLWKEDRYDHRERADVRTFFLRAAYAVAKAATLEAEYMLQRDEEGTTHRVEAGVKVRF